MPAGICFRERSRENGVPQRIGYKELKHDPHFGTRNSVINHDADELARKIVGHRVGLASSANAVEDLKMRGGFPRMIKHGLAQLGLFVSRKGAARRHLLEM